MRIATVFSYWKGAGSIWGFCCWAPKAAWKKPLWTFCGLFIVTFRSWQADSVDSGCSNCTQTSPPYPVEPCCVAVNSIHGHTFPGQTDPYNPERCQPLPVKVSEKLLRIPQGPPVFEWRVLGADLEGEGGAPRSITGSGGAAWKGIDGNGWAARQGDSVLLTHPVVRCYGNTGAMVESGQCSWIGGSS